MAADGGYAAKIGFDPNAGRQRGAGLHAGDDFPMLCETCLGSNPYVRMVKTQFGQKLCKISHAPYQGFRWKAGPQGRYKETIISFAVARERNICQACLNDMQYGLPVGVRDALLAKSGNQIAVPESAVGAAVFYAEQAKQNSEYGTQNSFSSDIDNMAASRQLDRFSKAMHDAESHNRDKIAFRNLPKLCSFWLNGTCTRVNRKVCPFRPCCGVFIFPELASTSRDLMQALIDKLKSEGPAEVQKKLDAETKAAFRDSMKGNRDESIKRRVHGDDDLTRKYLGKMRAGQSELTVPSDSSITTLWAGNLTPDITADDIREAFYPFGHISNIHVVAASKCAFVEYGSRAEAELAAKQLYKALTVKDQSLSLNWAKPRTQAAVGGGAGSSSLKATAQSVSTTLLPPPGMESAPPSAYALPGMAAPNIMLMAPGAYQSHSNDDSGAPLKRQRVEGSMYPSMNPQQNGSKL